MSLCAVAAAACGSFARYIPAVEVGFYFSHKRDRRERELKNQGNR
jgi:hypothetical protein